MKRYYTLIYQNNNYKVIVIEKSQPHSNINLISGSYQIWLFLNCTRCNCGQFKSIESQLQTTLDFLNKDEPKKALELFKDLIEQIYKDIEIDKLEQDIEIAKRNIDYLKNL